MSPLKAANDVSPLTLRNDVAPPGRNEAMFAPHVLQDSSFAKRHLARHRTSFA